jgi:heterodisulfide reductase subunit A2
LIQGDASLSALKTALFIQCVGSRIKERPYCSKVCCTHSIKNALALKALRPEMDVIVLYRDMRSYGLREDLYRKAREEGIIFLKYDESKGLDVKQAGSDLEVVFTDTALRRRMIVRPDLMVLAAAMVPPRDNPLAQMFKVTLNDDGFFMEAHVKLRPVDCATDGVFICGLAHGPKPLDESITQAQAAATRAVTLLAKTSIRVAGTVAETNPANCSACGVCAAICPYSAPAFIDKGPYTGKAKINSVLCKGCGLCVASCRSGAIRLQGFADDQILAQIHAFNEA